MNITVLDLLNKNYSNIIDIRSIEKYNDNHIPGAKNIPMILLLKDPSKYLDYNQVYCIYCQKGINSSRTCQYLLSKGYRVYNIIGGYEEWLLKK